MSLAARRAWKGERLGRAPWRSETLGRAALVIANLLGLLAFLWPFLLPVALDGRDAHAGDAPWVLAILLGCLGAALFVELGRPGLGPKAVALIGVLGAAMVALRLPGFVGGFSPMTIIVLVAGSSFGPRFGFILGAVGTFASGLFVGGLGPWLPFQMVAIGWVGAGAGLIPRPRDPRLRIGALAAYGFVVAFLFGALMNLWFWPFAAGSSEIGWSATAGVAANLGNYLAFYGVTSVYWDAFGAAGNALAIVFLGRPVTAALDRAARRMTLVMSPAPERRIIEAEPAGRPRPGPDQGAGSRKVRTP